MSLAVYTSAAFKTASGLSIAAAAQVAVRREDTGGLASIYRDAEGATPENNPFNADSSGNFVFYAAGLQGGYKITVTSGAETQTLRNQAIGTAAQLDIEDFVSGLPSVLDGMTAAQRADVTGLVGSVDVTAAIRAALAANTTVRFPRGKYKVSKISGSAALTMPTGSVWIMEGAELLHDTAADTTILCSAITDFAILGKWKITGGGSTVGTAKGLNISDCERFWIERPAMSSIKGWGIYFDPGSSTKERSRRGTIESPDIDQCYYGWEDVPGTGAEYLSVLNPRVTRCTSHNIKSCAGNVNWIGGHCVDGADIGFFLANGSNHAHGIVNGMNINHNANYNLKALQVTNGQTFANCHFYDGDIWLDRCKGININGGDLDAPNVYNDSDPGSPGGTSGNNYIRNMNCPGAYGGTVITDTGTGKDQLVVLGCTGVGSYHGITGVSINDPTEVYVHATRGASATQLLTNIGGNNYADFLTFPTEASNGDRRNAFDGTTFTAPSAGQYNVAFNTVFDIGNIGNTSTLELFINGAAKHLFLPQLYSTAVACFQGNVPLYLNAGDTLKLKATIVDSAAGSPNVTPTFGRATYVNSLEISRIA